MFMKMIAWVERHPWLTLSGVGLITVAFMAAAVSLGLKSESDFTKFMPQDNPSVAAFNRAKDTYGSQDLFLVSLVAPDTIFNAKTLAKFKAMEERLDALPETDKVRGPATADVIYGTQNAIVVEDAMPTVPQTPEAIATYRARVLADRNLRGIVVAENGKAGAISIKLTLGADVPTAVKKIEAIAAEYAGPEKIYVAGEPVLRSTVAEVMVSDLQRLVPFVVLILLLVLFLSFRSLRSVFIPLSVVIVSAIWAIGTMALFDQPMTPFSVLMPVMLIAIGAADGIHILNKYYEEAAQGNRHRQEIVLNTMGEMLSPIILTSLTTAAGFLALLGSFMWPQRSFGVITAVGIMYALALSLTLLPALLARLPVPKPRAKKADFGRSWISTALAAWARLATRQRVGFIVAAALILVLFATALPRLSIETKPEAFLGGDSPVVRSLHVMDENFGGSRQLAIEVRTGERDGLKKPEVLQQIQALQDYLLSLPKVGQVSSVAKIVAQMNETLHASDPTYHVVPDDPRLAAQIFILYSGDLDNMALGDFSRGEVVARVKSMDSEEMIALVGEVKGYLATHFDGAVKAEMVGSIREFASLIPMISNSQMISLLLSLAGAFFIVVLLRRSWMFGILSVIPLVFTVVIAFGSMVLLNIPLDIATVMLSSIAIGIGIDYSIHFLSRYQEEFRQNLSHAQAYENAMRTAGKGIYFNAIALILSFGVLLLSSFQGNVNFGRLVMLTMIISSISAMTVIPTLLASKAMRFLEDIPGGGDHTKQRAVTSQSTETTH